MYAMVGTRPDIVFAVGYLGRFSSNPTEFNLNMAKKCVRFFFLAMATTAANASNLKYINFNNQQIHNNIHNTIITLFNTSTKNINTLLNTSLKALLQTPPNSSTPPTQTPSFPPSPISTSSPSPPTISKGPLSPPIPNLRW